MIIFTPIITFPENYLDYKGIKNIIKYNLSSYNSDVQSLGSLIPNPEFIPEDCITGDCSTAEFDMAYHASIFNNPNSFYQFMNLIIPVYMYPDLLVQILINKSPYRDIITESLIKLIQQRYGYNSFIINEIDDILYTDEPDFSISGLVALDNDIEQYRNMFPESVLIGDQYD